MRLDLAESYYIIDRKRLHRQRFADYALLAAETCWSDDWLCAPRCLTALLQTRSGKLAIPQTTID
jgi:hypothetical protein